MTILLTGCAGFIGSHLLEALLREGHNVIGVDNLSTGQESNMATSYLIAKPNQFVFHRSNICNWALSPVGADVIIHLAALGSVPRSIEVPMGTFKSNVEGTQAIFECARVNGIGRVLYASSSSVYGEQPGLKYEGMDISKPLSPYAASKCFAEILAHSYAHAYGINMTGLRFFNVYGPRQRADSVYAAVVPKFCNALLHGQPMQVYGDGQQKRTFTPVKFVVDSILGLLDTELVDVQPGPLNITDESFALTVEALGYAIAQALNKKPEMHHLSERTGDIRESVGTGQILRVLLGTSPAPGLFRDALKKTCEWYAAHC